MTVLPTCGAPDAPRLPLFSIGLLGFGTPPYPSEVTFDLPPAWGTPQHRAECAAAFRNFRVAGQRALWRVHEWARTGGKARHRLAPDVTPEQIHAAIEDERRRAPGLKAEEYQSRTAKELRLGSARTLRRRLEGAERE